MEQSNFRRETFRMLCSRLHAAYFNLQKPVNEREYKILLDLLDGYLMMLTILVNPEINSSKIIMDRILSSSALNENEIDSLYYALIAQESDNPN